MEFERAVLREFQGRLIRDPAEPCVALVCPNDNPAMTLYHQLVQKDGKQGFSPEKIHIIASEDFVPEAIERFQTEFNETLQRIGTTYAVAPYTVGFARFGKNDEADCESLLRMISQRECFATYVENWLKTPEGFDTMLEDFSRDDHEHVPAEVIREFLEDDSEGLSADRIAAAKYNYCIYFACDITSAKHPKYVKKRLDEFRHATIPVTQDQLNWHLTNFYELENVDEKELHESNIATYRESPRLLNKIWPF